MLLADAQAILAQAIAPLSYDHFFDDVIGQKPLKLPATNTSNRHLLLGSDPKKVILNAFKEYAHTLKCHAQTPKGPAPTARPVPDATAFQALIDQYHRNDYTVRIPEVDGISPGLSQFTRALEVIFRKPAGAILFWSGAQARAPIHHDRVDVIAIQLMGSKRWYISDEQALLPNKWPQIGDQPPSLGRYSTYDVNPGDMIYFPRGTAHTVESTTESIHVAIEFVPFTIRDAINAALDHFSNLNRPVRLGAGCRADDLASGKALKTIQQQIRNSLADLGASCQSEAFIQRALDHTHARMINDLPRLQAPETPPRITIDSKVRQNALATAQLMTTQEFVEFTQPGEQILVHRGAEECLKFIASRQEFRVADIPGNISDDIRVALTTRLLMTGFLELAA